MELGKIEVERKDPLVDCLQNLYKEIAALRERVAVLERNKTEQKGE